SATIAAKNASTFPLRQPAPTPTVAPAEMIRVGPVNQAVVDHGLWAVIHDLVTWVRGHSNNAGNILAYGVAGATARSASAPWFVNLAAQSDINGGQNVHYPFWTTSTGDPPSASFITGSQ
ncbi:hypothetical protein BGZ74_005694, partial [Mortierella antarctica]